MKKLFSHLKFALLMLLSLPIAFILLSGIFYIDSRNDHQKEQIINQIICFIKL